MSDDQGLRRTGPHIRRQRHHTQWKCLLGQRWGNMLVVDTRAAPQVPQVPFQLR